MKTSPKDFRKLRSLLQTKSLEWDDHVLMRLQAGARSLRTEDEIIALLRTTPEEIRHQYGRIKAYYRRKEGRYTLILVEEKRTIRIVTFMEEP